MDSQKNLPEPAAAWTIRAVLVLIGFTAVVAQIVLMRELIVIFYGNEVSLGLMLASWLFWAAVGSSLLGRLVARLRPARRLVAGLEVLIAAAFPVTIWAARASRWVFQSLPGEILGPGPMLAVSFLVLSAFCALSGWLFAAGIRLYAEEAGASTARATGVVYLLEAAGSGVGGILASLVLIRYLSPFEIASLVGLLNLLAAAGLVIRARAMRRIVTAALLIGAVLCFAASRRVEAVSLSYL